MTKYKCGHTMTMVLMNDCPMSIAAYFGWAYSVGVFGKRSKCFTCYLKDCKKDFERSKKLGLTKKVEKDGTVR